MRSQRSMLLFFRSWMLCLAGLILLVTACGGSNSTAPDVKQLIKDAQAAIRQVSSYQRMRMHSLPEIMYKYRSSRLVISNMFFSLVAGNLPLACSTHAHYRIHRKGSRRSWVIFRIPVHQATRMPMEGRAGTSVESLILHTWQVSQVAAHRQARPMISPPV